MAIGCIAPSDKRAERLYPDAFVCLHSEPDAFIRWLNDPTSTANRKPPWGDESWKQYVANPTQPHGYQEHARKHGKRRILWVASTDFERILYEVPVVPVPKGAHDHEA